MIVNNIFFSPKTKGLNFKSMFALMIFFPSELQINGFTQIFNMTTEIETLPGK